MTCVLTTFNFIPGHIIAERKPTITCHLLGLLIEKSAQRVETTPARQSSQASKWKVCIVIHYFTDAAISVGVASCIPIFIKL